VIADWDYDNLYRLTKETIKVDSNTVRITEYHYDNVGNRELKTLIEGNNRYDTMYAYDEMDRLLSESTTTTVLADAVAGPDDIWLAAHPRRAGYYAFIAFCGLALAAALSPLQRPSPNPHKTTSLEKYPRAVSLQTQERTD